MRNKKKELLNNSLDVTSYDTKTGEFKFGAQAKKKKKGLTPEEEEELRKKQALLFQSSSNPLEMYESEMKQEYENPIIYTTTTPSFPVAEICDPDDPRFYDGSITQVLSNPKLNPPIPAKDVQQKSYPNEGESQNDKDSSEENEKEEVESEEIITTNQNQIVNEVDDESEDTPHGAPASNQNQFGRPPAHTLGHQISVMDIQPAPNHNQLMQDQMLQNQEILAQYNLARAKTKQPLIKDEEEDFD